MANEITKPEYWLVAIGFIVILTFALLLFGNSLQNNDSVSLDNDSAEYITDYTNQMKIAKLNETANDDLENKSLENPVVSALGSIPVISDILGVFSFVGKVLTGFWNFFAIVFSLPSFFISSFGFNLQNTKFIINVIGNLLFLAGVIMLVRLSK